MYRNTIDGEFLKGLADQSLPGIDRAVDVMVRDKGLEKSNGALRKVDVICWKLARLNVTIDLNSVKFARSFKNRID